MARYNKIYAGPAEQVKPQVVEAPANADILPGVLAVLSSGKFVAASASDTGRVYAIQDNYLIGKGVDDAIKANETAIGIELMGDQLLNLRLPTGVNVGKDAALTIGIELVGSILILTGRFLWLGAGMLGVFTLLAAFTANAFWTMPAGQDRFMATNAFFEHVGLIGGFVLVALVAERERRDA